MEEKSKEHEKSEEEEEMETNGTGILKSEVIAKLTVSLALTKAIYDEADKTGEYPFAEEQVQEAVESALESARAYYEAP